MLRGVFLQSPLIMNIPFTAVSYSISSLLHFQHVSSGLTILSTDIQYCCWVIMQAHSSVPLFSCWSGHHIQGHIWTSMAVFFFFTFGYLDVCVVGVYKLSCKHLFLLHMADRICMWSTFWWDPWSLGILKLARLVTLNCLTGDWPWINW